MINELQLLTEAMREANISAASWHREYIPIPNIKKNAPCIRIVLDNGKISLVESVPEENGSIIRKYGNNQGSFPAMNLTPLFFISKEQRTLKETIQQSIRDETANLNLEEVKSWCTVSNWNEKFFRKYRICMVERPKRLNSLLQAQFSFAPVLSLIHAVQAFENPMTFHQALMDACFEMIENRRNVALALRMLFFYEGGNENISVVLDTFDLEYNDYTTIGSRFTNGFNKALLSADSETKKLTGVPDTDAFGIAFSPLEEPMPTVKLPAGFSATLRTMFRGQPCQKRYNRIENASYPISPAKRAELKSALEWISAPENERITWISTGKDEALFVYPSRLRKQSISYTAIFNREKDADGKEALFTAEAKRFTQHITNLREYDPEYCPDMIQVFFLRKLDKARTKVVYSRNTSPQEIIRRSTLWVDASENLPLFHFGKPDTPFPMQIASILNRSWRQDGSLVSDKYRAVQSYHGLEMFFDPEEGKSEHDLQIIVRGCEDLAIYAGRYLCIHNLLMPLKTLLCLKESLAVMGMLLYWMGSGKDRYMNEFPYLLGQLLKVSDSLHELYCVAVRKQIPAQLVGGSMYSAAAESPQRCIAQLGQRMMPYLNWARTNKDVRIPKDKDNSDSKEGPTSAYYLHLYAQVANKLKPVMSEQVRFSDAEKAQLFIGYMASFPKKDNQNNNIEG